MITCRKCGEEFSSWTKIGGKRRNLGSRVFCLNCSPFGNQGRGLRNGQRKRKKQVVGESIVCTDCGRSYVYRRNAGATLRRCNTCLVRDRQRRMKIRAVEYKGGKCVECGYSKCARAMDFHHLDPAEKEFTISHHWNRAWKTLRVELDKCVLLCCRCHAELEAGILTLA